MEPIQADARDSGTLRKDDEGRISEEEFTLGREWEIYLSRYGSLAHADPRGLLSFMCEENRRVDS